MNATSAAAPAAAPRGRPRSITAERIVEAGMRIGLPKITFVGVAAELGVSHMALYKHVENLDALKRWVAESIFERWQLPEADGTPHAALADYLLAFSASLRALVEANPGLTPYLVRRGAKTAAMAAKIDAHHAAIARAYGLPQAQARWLLSTVAYHCIALADTVYSTATGRPGAAGPATAHATTSAPDATATATTSANANANADADADANTLATATVLDTEIEAEFALGMRALIVGALALLERPGDMPPWRFPSPR